MATATSKSIMNLKNAYCMYSNLSSSSRSLSSSASTMKTRALASSSSSSQSSSSGSNDQKWEFSGLKGVFCGSGSDMMNDPRTCQAILDLVFSDKKKPLSQVEVVYLGTATYDLNVFEQRQTQRFAELGCQVTALKVSEANVPSMSYMIKVMEKADVIVVGGGNTLYALDRWVSTGLDILLRGAMERGAVISGGSAGAICWFDGGHSNAMDPGTYKEYRIKKYGDVDPTSVGDELDMSAEYKFKRDWKYIRIPALGFLPGIVSPHHDRIQSNGVLRADDFDRCLLTTPGEIGIGIDHWAGLIIDGQDYSVFSLEEHEGSVGPDGSFVTDYSGRPGVWIKQVTSEGKIEKTLCPPSGKVTDLLRPAAFIVNDYEAIETCRMENPTPPTIFLED